MAEIAEAEEKAKTAEPDAIAEAGADDESGVEISPELERQFEKTKDEVNRRDLVARRMEVRDAWEQRYFWRGHQYLDEGPYGQWAFAGEGQFLTGRPLDDEETIDETNIYRAYGLKIIGVLTQNVPGVRFFADSLKNPHDLTRASGSNTMRQIIERQNPMTAVLEDIARYLYTDGRAVVIVNSERAEDDAGDEQIFERFEVAGTLESKLPIQQNSLEKCFYCVVSKEIDILEAKKKFPQVKDEIQAQSAPAAESEFERLARIACMQGMRPSSLTGDSLQWNVTYQRVYLTPDAYENYDDDTKAEALEKFPRGVCLHYVGKTFCEAEPCRMLDKLTLIHAVSGDGMHRNSIGSPAVSVQKKLNDAIELQQTTLMETIPVKWVPPNYIDLAALPQQRNMAGSYLKLASVPPDGDLTKVMFQEEQLDVPPSLPPWIAALRDDFMQLLTGAYPAMSGDDTGGNDTAQGIAIQKDSAMGLIGIYWRNIKAGYASLMTSAVICAAENREGTVTATVPGRTGAPRNVSVDIEDLRTGRAHCYPETDENYPMSWVQQQAVVKQLMMDQDPNIIALRNMPENLMLIKQMIGVPGLTIPQTSSYLKQLNEIEELLEGTPEPNPQAVAAKQHLAQLEANPALKSDPQVQAVAAQLQQVAGLPDVPSVPIDENYDDHAAEFQTVTTWVNSPEGQQAKLENPQGFQNVRLHGLAHKAAMGSSNKPAKPPSVSIALKDLPPKEAAEAAQQAGIDASPQDFEAQNATAAAEKHPGPGGITVQ